MSLHVPSGIVSNWQVEEQNSAVTLINRLKSCRDLNSGKKLHAEVAECGHLSNIYVASSLVTMYSKCGSTSQARQIFNCMQTRDLATWNSLILGYATNGETHKALELFSTLLNSYQQWSCAPPNARTFLAVLMAFKKDGTEKNKLEMVMAVHSQAVTSGCGFSILVSNALVDRYATCGSMADSRRVFDRMQRHDVVSWTALMSGYAENGQPGAALELFVTMCCNGFSPDGRAYMAAFKACAILAAGEEFERVGGMLVKPKALERAMALHAHAGRRLESDDVYVANTVLDMYAKCGSLDDATMVFQRIEPGRLDVVSWNTLMLGYAENGEPEAALHMLESMLSSRGKCAPNARTFVAALKACTRLAFICEFESGKNKLQALEKGMAVHALAAEWGCDTAIFVVNGLVDMYGRYGSMTDARRAFDRVHAPDYDVVSWSTLILNYADNGDHESALQLFSSMSCKADTRTFLAALRACTSMASQGMTEESKAEALEKGMAIHSQATKLGFDSNAILVNVLIDMYSKCGSMLDAHAAFQQLPEPDVVSWTSLVLGYAENGQPETALETFAAMQAQECASTSRTNARSFVAAVKACTCVAEREKGLTVKMKALELGMAIHSLAAKTEACDLEDIYFLNALVDLYSKCGSMTDAWKVFQRIKTPDVITWTSIVLGYAENGQARLAMELFTSMECAPNSLTCAAAFKACGSTSSLQAGKVVEALVWRYGVEVDGVLETCMVDFYGKCGCVAQAQLVFESVTGASKDLVAWTALISGYAYRNSLDGMFTIFHDMLDQGLEPNSVTFLTLLTACSHAGDVEKGKYCFEIMQRRYGMTPEREHYHCMIDLLGRANQVEAALAMVQAMPYKPNDVTWTTLLASCTKWKNGEVGNLSFESMVKLDEKRAAAYILMANIHGTSREKLPLHT